eukprot:3172294-Prymnesium_polylepis.1
MQIDSAGEGSSRSAPAFGSPAAHGTQLAGVGAAVAAVIVWGLQVELELGPQRGAGWRQEVTAGLVGGWRRGCARAR